MTLVRGSGVLLHPTSLPGPFGSGDLGDDAVRFVDFLHRGGQKYWQLLPLAPTGYGNSPYSGLSAFAADPMLVDLRALQRKGWLDAADLHPAETSPIRIDFDANTKFRNERLRKASARFAAAPSEADKASYVRFCHQHASWLEDWVLFAALNEAHGFREWSSWSPALARREPTALAEARRTFEADLRHHRFVQWCFFEQWAHLKAAANQRGIKLVGDVPIFVAYHSADVWANQRLFFLDEDGRSTVVAGVPPDYFSETGQRWGNPLYRWDVLAREGYRFWVDRMRLLFELVDVARIDHFRGFEAYWEIPAAEETAIKGRWVKGPGDAIFEALRRALGNVPIIAEDLGIITPEVTALRLRQGYPGMKILQFAFGGDAKNLYLPHNHERAAVVYTGTHDNDTTAGWWSVAKAAEREHAHKYLGLRDSDSPAEVAWAFTRTAMASVADVAIFPFQDLLALGSEGRMNVPGRASGNWDWRFEWNAVPAGLAARLADLTRLYGRAE